MTSSVAPLYAGWQLANNQLVDLLGPLPAGHLQLPVGSPTWPIWASAAHIAGARVYWLCHVFGEPGAEDTPFRDPSGVLSPEAWLAATGWEDELDHPRNADEIVGALQSSWRIVERCLQSWTIDTLPREARRVRGDEVQFHSRQSVLMRLITHDAYHCGEISLVLGSHGLGAIDMWRGLARTVAP